MGSCCSKISAFTNFSPSSLDGNDLGPLTLTAAAKCLRHNRRLVRLGLKGSTEQVPQHCDDLARTLEYHPSLIELQ